MRKGLIILSVLLFLASSFINVLERRIYPPELRDEYRYVVRKELVALMSLDHRGFAADLLFIKVILHSGSLVWKPRQFVFDRQWSYATMDLVTDLDPRYYEAYLFSAMGLIHYFDDVKLARPILDKGMSHFPESWELPFWIGYDYYVYLEDYQTAGEYFWLAAQKPNAPKRFFSMMTSALRRGGAYERGIWALTAMMESTSDEKVRAVYKKKIEQLETLVLLQRAAERFRSLFGRFPSDPEELVSAGVIDALPDAGEGGNYAWDEEGQRFVLKDQ